MATTAELFEVGPGAPRAAAGEGRERCGCRRDAGPARVAGRRGGQWTGLTREPGSGEPGLAVQILATVLRGTAELRLWGASPCRRSDKLRSRTGVPAGLPYSRKGWEDSFQDNKGLLSLTTEGKRHILLTAFNCCGTIQLLVRGSLGCERLWGRSGAFLEYFNI